MNLKRRNPQAVVIVDDTDEITTLAPAPPSVFEDTDFQAADSPALWDINTDLGRNGSGYLVCDGDGSLEVEISVDGVTYGGPILVRMGNMLKFQRANRLLVTHLGTDSSYRGAAD